MKNDFALGSFAATKGYFQHGEWRPDNTLSGFAVGKIVASTEHTRTLMFAAGNTVELGIGLLSEPLDWEIESWKRMRGEAA